jgi:hypothetical protein
MALPRILAAVAIAAGLLVPAAAQAATPVERAASVAVRFWGATPCDGRVVITAKRPFLAVAGGGSDAWVTFSSPLGANNLAAPADSFSDCTIDFARRRWPTASSMRQDWGIFCATMVHEWGHLLGHVHEATPGSVMLPVFTDESSVPALCRSASPKRR